MPEILHESKGLKIVQNTKNRFVVVSLHYTADPGKRSPQWLSEAKAGMPPAQFQREYEIDYSALMGEKVFPEIGRSRDKIIVHPPFPEWSDDQPYWGGFDYGERNPSSLHIYTIDDDCIYSVWELFEPCKNIPEFAAKMKACPYWDRLRYIACDPDIIDSKKTHDAWGNPTTVGALLQAQGINKLLRGNNNEDTFIAEVRRRWASVEDPTFKIFDTCVNQIREFENALYPTMSERASLTSNYQEKIVDKDNHALDDCKYFLNSRPRKVNHQVVMPVMHKKWMH